MAANFGRAPWWDFPRTSTASRHIVDVGVAHGLGASECLIGTGLTPDDLHDPRTVVQATQELTIARNLVAQLENQEFLGIEAGSKYQLSSLGLLGYALLACGTFREAIEVAVRYIRLSSAFVDMRFERSTPVSMRLVFDTAEIPSDVRAFFVARDLAAIASTVPTLLDQRLFTGSASVELEGYPQLAAVLELGLQLKVNSAGRRNALTMDDALLDRPMPRADPETALACVQQCEALLDRHSRRTGFTASVRARLIRDPAGIPSRASVAAELAMTERTLHRRLLAEGTSFRDLLQEVREALADELLTNGLTVEQVSRQLGYADASAFTHAYTRWRGHPPSLRRSL